MIQVGGANGHRFHIEESMMAFFAWGIDYVLRRVYERLLAAVIYSWGSTSSQPAQHPLIQGWSSSPSVVHWRQTKHANLTGCWTATFFHLTLKNHFSISYRRKKFTFLIYIISPHLPADLFSHLSFETFRSSYLSIFKLIF